MLLRSSLVASLLLTVGGASAFACSGSVEDASPPDAGLTSSPPTNSGVRDAGGDADTPLRNVTNVKVVDLGAVTSGAEVALDVPAGALGFHVVVEGDDPTVPIGIEQITSPSGEVVHAAFTPKGGSHATSESVLGPIAAVGVPQSEAKSANTPEPGRWRIRFGSRGTTPPPPSDAGGDDGGVDGGAPPGDAGTQGIPLRAEARIQMGSPTGFVGGRLDLNVWIPEGLELDRARLDASSAEASEAIQRRLEIFYAALSDHVGIDRGKVTFLPAPRALRVVDTEDKLLDAFGASTGRPADQALNVVFTNAIDFGDGISAWGIAPGIPGVAMRTGTPLSGIILAIGDTPSTGDGLTLLHEAGHFFGLNHTTELYDGYADPLADTPKCDGISIEDPTTLTKCPDRKNLMFPAFYGTSAGSVQLSDAQRAVLRGSPVYRAYADGTLPQGTMSRRSFAFSLTKSGRALNETEQWLAATMCPHGRVDPRRYVATRGDAALAELRAAAESSDLPSVMRRRAARVLTALGEERAR